MAYDRESCWCYSCGVEITWGPWLKAEHPYCCQDCLRGYPCRCRERVELEDDRRQSSAAALPTSYEAY